MEIRNWWGKAQNKSEWPHIISSAKVDYKGGEDKRKSGELYFLGIGASSIRLKLLFLNDRQIIGNSRWTIVIVNAIVVIQLFLF